MQMTYFVTFGVISVALGSQVKINRHVQESSEPETLSVIRQELKNEGDVQYTGKISLGGQDIEVVPDTGSFELVILSEKCDACGDESKLFHSNKSKSLKEGTLKAEQNYGSGSTDSLEAYDNVKVGHLTVNQQMFWEVYAANMPLLEYSTFGGILGLGPPSSNVKMANKDAREVKKDVSNMADQGENVSAYWPIVKQYEAVANFSKTVDLWLSGVKVQHFSVCLQRGNGSPGVVVYNDDSDFNLFTKKIDVVAKTEDDVYWAANVESVKLGATKKGNDERHLGGGDGHMMILDSGTSLIAAPQSALDKVVDAMDKYSHISNGCKNLNDLPDLEFVFGGEHFSLPPEAYMGEMDGNDFPDFALEVMPHLKPMHEQLMSRNVDVEASNHSKTMCAPLIMSMGDDNMWILGMPFFRKYYTRFTLSDDLLNARAIHFAEAGKHCSLGNVSSQIRLGVDEFRGVPMRVDLKKILPPKAMHRLARRTRE